MVLLPSLENNSTICSNGSMTEEQDNSTSEHPETEPLETPIRFLEGVGPHRAKLLKNLDVETVRDLLWLIPRDIVDLSHLSLVNDLTDDRIHTIRGQIIDSDSRAISRGRTMTAALMRVDDGLVRGMWFNQPWMLRQLQSERFLLWSAKPKFRDNRWEMSHPRMQWLEEDDENSRGEVLTKYRLTEGITLDILRGYIRTALEFVKGTLADDLPERLRKHYKLPHLEEAISNLHRPPTVEDFYAARRRLVFDEQLDFQIGMALRRRLRQTTERSPEIIVTPKINARIRRLFDFTFTDGQEQAITEIVDDLKESRPMHRLLQADVGAGKTLVALYAMLATVAAGYQAVLMAPTELLAQQHWNTIHEALLHSRVKRCLLTGSLKPAERRDRLAKIASGEMQMIFGTQAVIQNDVQYSQLGLTVVDEQHKFGVVQRGRFQAREMVPHVLVMTATPIPRSLCLTQYGDLDLSTMTDLPPGRQPIVTSLVQTPKVEAKAWQFVIEKLREGRQAYIVCPYIDSPDPEAPAGALQIFDQLQHNELRDFQLGLIHGQMDRAEQQVVMSRFRDRQLDAIVATTVVEVGVDVPNATLMIIQDAQQFGLSQLHQLRGRIGRGSFRGYCFLFSMKASDESLQRLQAVERSNNGFEIAEADFALRGPGNVLGTEQHGSQPFRVTDFSRDEKILLETSRAASRMVQAGTIDEPDFAPLKRRVLERFGDQLGLTRTG